MNNFLTLLLSISHFSQSDGKEKKELHNHAEMAFQHSDYVAAKKAYAELFKKIETPQDDWQNYVDIVVRYAEAHLVLKEYREGEELLLNLLKQNPPLEFTPRITVLLGRLYSFQENAGQGYLKMRQAALSIPLEKWRPEERSFFHAVEYALNAYYENLLQKAKHFMHASSYKDATNALELTIEGIKSGFFPAAIDNRILEKKVLFRLAECHFLSANFDKTLKITDSIAPPKDELDAEMLFLAALCYKEKREYEKALLCFQNYLITNNTASFHYDNALYEIGLFYFRNGNIKRAREYLEKLNQRKENATRPVIIGALYLGKIYLQEKRNQDAEALFAFVQEKLKNDDPLFFEASFLQGELAFNQKCFQKASQFFEQALNPIGAKGDWTKCALYKLALCYLHQAGSEYLKKGESILEKLLHHEYDEEITLVLADFYVSEKNLAKFNSLREQVQNHLSEKGTYEFLLLESNLKNSYEEKEEIFQKVINNADKLPNELIANSFYSLALNDLDRGLKNEVEKDFYFRRAIESLEKAFVLIEHSDEEVASEVLQLEVKAHSLLKDSKLTLSLLNKLNLGVRSQERLYLKGLLLSQIEEPEYKIFAIKIFEELLSSYPDGGYAADTLFALATLYYKFENFSLAEAHFIKLVEQYPLSKYAQEGFFWAAEAAEKKGEPKDKCQNLRIQCFERYPFSSKAADAYFRCYSIEEYLQGEKKALSHIHSFPSLFPSSEFLPLSYFILGYHESSYPLAKATLEKALDLFKAVSNPDPSFILFRYRTMLEIALLDIRHGKETSGALSMLLNLVSELQDMPEALKQKNPYPPIYEESEFALFQIYCNLKKETLAYEVLLSMLKHYSEAGITEGFYLSEVWKEQGLLAQAAKDELTAISCFEVALECGEKYLNTEQRFSLLLNQSNCYRQLGHYDQAMRTLSQIINENSASHLRLKAMFLRSEIYEIQGREQLSIRQLMSLAKQQGKWALEAKEKLRKVYGICE